MINIMKADGTSTGYRKEQAGNLNFMSGTAYELDSQMDADARLVQASNAKKYAYTRVKPNWLKLFMGSIVETST